MSETAANRRRAIKMLPTRDRSKYKSAKSSMENNTWDQRYKMDHKNRGIAILINCAADISKDVYNLGTTLKKLRFEVIQLNNSKKNEIFSRVEEVAKMDHTDNDCLFIAILAKSCWNGKIQAMDKPFRFEDIYERFARENCESLTGKPKLFFVQVLNDSKEILLDGFVVDCIHYSERIIQIPFLADFLVMYIETTNFAEAGDNSATRFYQELDKQLASNKLVDLMSVLITVTRQTNTNGKNAHDKGFTQTSMISSTLTKEINFN